MPFIAPNAKTRTEWLNNSSDSCCRTSSAASRAILLSGIFTPEIMQTSFPVAISPVGRRSRRRFGAMDAARHADDRLEANCSCGLLDHRLRRVSKADRQTVIDVHKSDRDRQIHQFPLLEHGACGLVGLIRYAGFGNARHRFGPG